MSSPATHDHDHDDGAVHAHVSSVPFYVAVFLGLLFLTGLVGVRDMRPGVMADLVAGLGDGG